MAINRDLVRNIARLAYLDVGEAELDRLARELGAILDHVAEIGRLDLSGVEPTSHGVPLPPLFRPDEVGPHLPTERALQGAPKALEGGFAVPKVVE